MIKQWVVPVLAVSTMVSAGAVRADDAAAVRQTILDFVEGCYAADQERVARAFHPDLDKSGFGRRPDGSWVSGEHTYAKIIEDCSRLYTEVLDLPADPKKEIVIYEVLEKTASAKLVADWGIDYFHLAKYEGEWLIKNSLGQSHPLGNHSEKTAD